MSVRLTKRKLVIILSITGIILLVSVVLVILLTKAPQEPNSAYAQTLSSYISELQNSGLLVVEKQIHPSDGGDPFIDILAPAGEVSNDQINYLVDLIIRGAEVFENHKGLRSDDIFMAFERPAYQQIIFVSRPGGLPSPIGMINEATITLNDRPGVVFSVVNLEGELKTPGREFTIAWATLQAVCLGYGTGQSEDADPICNIISANAAAAWVGMARDHAMEWLNSGGSTDLAYLGSEDYQFRFIDFVFDEFVR